jgi:hypothetical protein
MQITLNPDAKQHPHKQQTSPKHIGNRHLSPLALIQKSGLNFLLKTLRSMLSLPKPDLPDLRCGPDEGMANKRPCGKGNKMSKARANKVQLTKVTEGGQHRQPQLKRNSTAPHNAAQYSHSK